MSSEAMALYKLIVLYMLDKVVYPLTKAQVCDFILEHEYTNFMTLQQAVAELTDTDLIMAKPIRNRTHLSITPEGRQTLSYFENRISDSIKEDVEKFFNENELEIQNEISVTGDFYKATSGEYEAHLVGREKGVSLVEITMSVPDESTASAICDNWQKNNQQIYKFLVEKLF